MLVYAPLTVGEVVVLAPSGSAGAPKTRAKTDPGASLKAMPEVAITLPVVACSASLIGRVSDVDWVDIKVLLCGRYPDVVVSEAVVSCTVEERVAPSVCLSDVGFGADEEKAALSTGVSEVTFGAVEERAALSVGAGSPDSSLRGTSSKSSRSTADFSVTASG